MVTEWIQGMEPQILMWLILVVVFVVIELITVGLTSIWFGAGALCALLLAAFTKANFLIQILVFLLVSAVLMIATRPFARKFVNSRIQKTNLDDLKGKNVLITERVSNAEQSGKGELNGQEWTVRSENDGEEFEEGEYGKIVMISGVKLIVTKNN